MHEDDTHENVANATMNRHTVLKMSKESKCKYNKSPGENQQQWKWSNTEG